MSTQEDLSGSYQPVSHAEWLSAKEEGRKDEKHAHDLKQAGFDARDRRWLDRATCAGLFLFAAAASIGALLQPAAASWLAGLAGACLGFVGQKFVKSVSK